MKRVKKIARLLLNFFVISSLTLSLLEVSYRYQWIDFYSTEWNSLNENQENPSNEKVLIFGDSFSADPKGWVEKLREIDTNTNYFNASIPGVGLETFRLIAKDRLQEVNPTRVIVQLYVGNDLFDLDKPLNWSELSILRNLFWSFGSKFRVLNYLNYKSGQFSQPSVDSDSKLEESFTVSNYSKRTKLYIRAQKNYPLPAVNLDGESLEIFNELIEALNEIKEMLNKGVKLSVLVIPHCAQVHQKYRDRFRSLGSDLSELKVQENTWSKKLANEGFEVIDPFLTFKQNEELGKALYFENDPHLNRQGQELLSKFVKNQLQ
ncbi:MAG: hypothetical protein COA32_00625 [Fluviicola sp.]|nr:MAG: hypothetical protein COA32_00625 [Fluviicola sp.]